MCISLAPKAQHVASRVVTQAINQRVELEPGTGDDQYLGALAGALARAFEEFPNPDLLIYNAGTDILQGWWRGIIVRAVRLRAPTRPLRPLPARLPDVTVCLLRTLHFRLQATLLAGWASAPVAWCSETGWCGPRLWHTGHLSCSCSGGWVDGQAPSCCRTAVLCAVRLGAGAQPPHHGCRRRQAAPCRSVMCTPRRVPVLATPCPPTAAEVTRRHPLP